MQIKTSGYYILIVLIIIIESFDFVSNFIRYIYLCCFIHFIYFSFFNPFYFIQLVMTTLVAVAEQVPQHCVEQVVLQVVEQVDKHEPLHPE